MNLSLQQVLHEVKQLNPQEQWQVMECLMNQLKQQTSHEVRDGEGKAESDESRSSRSRTKLDEIDQLMRETSGILGRMSREEIDAELDRQRKFDWGE
jgi:hypothetical protein